MTFPYRTPCQILLQRGCQQRKRCRGTKRCMLLGWQPPVQQGETLVLQYTEQAATRRQATAWKPLPASQPPPLQDKLLQTAWRGKARQGEMATTCWCTCCSLGGNRRDARCRESTGNSGKHHTQQQQPNAPTAVKCQVSTRHMRLSPLVTSGTLIKQDKGSPGRALLPPHRCPALQLLPHQTRSGPPGMSRHCLQQRKVSPYAGSRRSLQPDRCSSP